MSPNDLPFVKGLSFPVESWIHARYFLGGKRRARAGPKTSFHRCFSQL